MDSSWLYTMIEASATFVAITSGFLTTKVISIASERGGLKNNIKLLESEILESNEIIKEIEKEIYDINYRWASEDSYHIKNYIKSLLEIYFENYDDKPDIDIIITFLNEKSKYKDEMDIYMEDVLRDEYDEIWQQVLKEKEKKEEKKKQKSIFVLKTEPLTENTYAIFKIDSNHSEKKIQQERLSEIILRKEGEESLNKKREARLIIFKDRLSLFILPKFIWFGFGSLVFYAGVGVIFPLLASYNVDKWIKYAPLFMILFIMGLISNIGYLFIEIINSFKE